MKDEEVLKALARANTRSEKSALLEQLFDSVSPWVLGLCRSEFGWTQDAEDCAQETLLQVAKGLPKFRKDSSLRTWIYTICKRTVVRHRRKLLSQPRHTEGMELDELADSKTLKAWEVVEKKERLRDLMKAIADLSEKQKHAVVLHYLEDKSISEAANIMGCREGTVKAHLNRARANLKGTLGKQGKRVNE